MNKSEIIAALKAAGVECDESMTVEQLKALAAEKNVSLVKEKPPEEVPVIPSPKDDELVAEKVRAGLGYEQAVEVVRRQREHDAKKRKK